MGAAGADVLRGRGLRAGDVPAVAPECAFDDLVFIAAEACAAPVALVTLHDRGQHRVEACWGPVPDAGLLADPTGAAGFHAAAPLIAGGATIGALRVLDPEPRPAGLLPSQARMLDALARQVVAQLELRRVLFDTAATAALQQTLILVGEQIRQSDDVADMTARAAATVGEALGVARAGYGILDMAAGTVAIQPGWTAPGVASLAGDYRLRDFGRLTEELSLGQALVIDDVAADPRTAAQAMALTALGVGALVNMPVRDRGEAVAILLVHAPAPRRWTAAELAFLRSVADRLEAGVSRAQAEAQQRTLNAEISHRLKNMLAMVQAIAGQTLRRVADREPIEVFERRLLALSTAHDVLMQTSWSSTDLATVLDAVLNSAGQDGRVAAAGPPIVLGPRASLCFSLLVHELMTNAVKYGALSQPGGHVSIGWAVEDHAGEPTLVVRWRERGGPAVAVPGRVGFGSKLIRLGLVGTGGVDLRYEPDGLQADLSASLSQLAQA